MIPARGTRLLVAFEASAVAGAVVARGPRAPRVKSHGRVGLPPGALVPSVTEPNVRDRASVSAALRRLAESLGVSGATACVVLPGGAARALYLEHANGVAPIEFGRYRLSSVLPYPAAEALIDVQPTGGDGMVAAAVRRSVVEGYEAVLQDAGLQQERLDVATVAALAALSQQPPQGAGGVDVILGEGTVTLAAYGGERVRALRTRLRAGDTAAWLLEEADRTARLTGATAALQLRVVGPGTRDLLAACRAAGRQACAGWENEPGSPAVDQAELPWLGAALA